MDLRRFRTGKNLTFLSITVVLLVLGAGYYFFRKPPRVAMEKYAPASALVFIEIDSLTDILDGLTHTRAWQDMAPVLGLSSQLNQLGSGIDWVSRTGLGPDEIVLAGRAQYGIVVTDVDASAQGNADDMSLRLKPRFALIAETHSANRNAEQLVNERTAILAKRIFGEAMKEEEQDHEGSRLKIFRGEGEDRQMVAAAYGSVVLLGNHETAVKTCLDAIARRAPTLEQDDLLQLRRQEVGANAAILAYFTQAGIEKFAQLAPALFATGVTSDPDRIGALANLLAHLSKQSSEGFFYGLEFVDDGVIERYLTVMRPELASGFREAFKLPTTFSQASLRLVPIDAVDCTILNVEAAGTIPERLLKSLTTSMDIVASLALREFVINFREQFGLVGGDSLDRAVGSEIAIVKEMEDEPTIMFVRVQDRNALAPILNRYLTKAGAKVYTKEFKGLELSVSTNEDGRAAAFVEDYLVLGTLNQLEKVVDTQSNSQSAARDTKVQSALQKLPPQAPLISYEADEKSAVELLLWVSKLTRVTDGSPELLASEPMRQVIEALPPSISHTQFREFGIYTETRSSVGFFGQLAGWVE